MRLRQERGRLRWDGGFFDGGSPHRIGKLGWLRLKVGVGVR